MKFFINMETFEKFYNPLNFVKSTTRHIVVCHGDGKASGRKVATAAAAKRHDDECAARTHCWLDDGSGRIRNVKSASETIHQIDGLRSFASCSAVFFLLRQGKSSK